LFLFFHLLFEHFVGFLKSSFGISHLYLQVVYYDLHLGCSVLFEEPELLPLLAEKHLDFLGLFLHILHLDVQLPYVFLEGVAGDERPDNDNPKDQGRKKLAPVGGCADDALEAAPQLFLFECVRVVLELSLLQVLVNGIVLCF